MIIDSQFRTRIKYSRDGKKSVYEISIIIDPGLRNNIVQKIFDLQIMIDRLDKEIANIDIFWMGNSIHWRRKLFRKIDIDIYRNFIGFIFFIEFSDFLFCLFKRIVSNFKKVIVFSNSFNVAGSRFLAVSDTLLNKISWIFRTSVIVKLHENHLLETLYHHIQHHTTFKMIKFDSKKTQKTYME